MQTINNVPTEIEWRVYRGDKSVLTLFLKDANGKPITNAQGVFCVARRFPQDHEVLSHMNTWFGTTRPEDGTQGDPSTGIIQVEIPWDNLIYPRDNQGNPIDPNQVAQPHIWGKQFYFDVQLQFENEVFTIVKVKVEIETDVSRGEGLN